MMRTTKQWSGKRFAEAHRTSAHLTQRGPQNAAAPQRVSGKTASPSPLAQTQQLAASSPAVARLASLQRVADQSPSAQRLAAMTAASAPVTGPNGTRHKAQTTQRYETGPLSTSHASAGGLPDTLRSGVETLSGMDMGDVRVHCGSPEQARAGALAFAQGHDIHLASGQDQHLPHEAWHVVQQAQGRVAPTRQVMGVALNDDPGLEAEADRMGQRALRAGTTRTGEGSEPPAMTAPPVQQKPVIQRLAGFEIELRIPFYGTATGVATDDTTFTSATAQELVPYARRQVVDFLYGGNAYGVSYGAVPGHYDISADHGAWQRPHKALRAHIEEKHLQPPAKRPSMAHLEYRTEPLEERDPTADARMRTIARAIETHATDSVRRAERGYTNALGAPVQNQMTGVPAAALRSMMRGDNKGTDLLATMINRFKPGLNYQTTVGTLPSEIPALFEESAADLDNKRPDRAKAALLRHSVARADAALNSADVARFVGSMDPGHKASLRGWMTLVAEHLLIDQLEVSSRRYKMRDTPAGQRLVRISGTPKNQTPYLSKTGIKSAKAALPLGARPVSVGPNAQNWYNVLQNLVRHCLPVNFDLVAMLGLENYAGQTHYNKDGTEKGTVWYGEVLHGKEPAEWVHKLFTDHEDGDKHIKSGHELTLDDQPGTLTPPLSIPREQAIPLEDRDTSSKASFAGRRSLDAIEDHVMKAWGSAVDRRLDSTAGRADGQRNYHRVYDALRAEFAALGDLPTLHFGLHYLKNRFDALPANPKHQPRSPMTLQILDRQFRTWRGDNSDAELALSQLTHLIERPGWTGKTRRKGVRPTGVRLMQAELAAGAAAGATLINLRDIAIVRLKGGWLLRKAVTKDLYALVRDTPGWLGNGGGWTNFVAHYNRVDGAV